MKPSDITYFEVTEYGTIRYADFDQVKTRSDAYDLSLTYDLSTPARLVDAAKNCPPLQWEIKGSYTEYRENPKYPERPKRMPEEPQEAWTDWVLSMDEETFSSLREGIKQWLSEEPHWPTEDDFIHCSKTNEGAVFCFFENEPSVVLDDLGVNIIDGDRPGSNYRGAELSTPIKKANAIAKAKGLSYRFRKAKE